MWGGVLILAALTLTACDNFLDAKETCNQIQSAIAYNNASSYRILVTAEKDSGIIRKPITGEVSKKVTDTFDIKFEPNDDFSFMGWNAYSEELPLEADINDYIEFEDAQDPETKVTFKKALNGIVIMAVCPHYPFTEFTLTGSNGKFSPVKGNYTCVMSHTYNLSFEPDMDWEFIRWQIYNKNTDEEIPNGKYIKIQNLLEENTTYSLVCPAEDDQISLGIRPIVTERPQILSYSPILSNELAYKDTTIQVIFDHDMDEHSIYYTDNELDSLMFELGIINKDDERLLKTKTNPKNYYGYKKNGESFFKNISLKDNKDSTSLNNFFEEPVFENPRTLSISVITDKNSLFKNYTKILVTLGNTFFYKERINDNIDKDINMAGSKKWIYQVNDTTDEDSPIVQTLTFGSLTSKDKPSMGNSEQIKQLNFLPDNHTYNLQISLKDEKSGPASSFIMLLQRIADSNYIEVSEQTITTVLDFDYINYKEASFSNDIDFSTLQDGVYAVKFIFSDRSNNPKTYPVDDEKFYFAVDNTVPTIPVPRAKFTISDPDNRISSNRMTLSFSATELSRDIDSINITYVTSDETTGSVVYEKTVNEDNSIDFTFTVDPEMEYYNYSIKAVDTKGNENLITKKVGAKTICNGFVEVFGKTVTGAINDSQVFIDGRTIVIPDMYVCDHEITQGEYEEYMTYYGIEKDKNYNKPTDNFGIGAMIPAYYLSWYEAIIYCNLRSRAENLNPVYYITINGQDKKEIEDWMNYCNSIEKNNNNKYYCDRLQLDILDNPTTGIKYDETADGYRLPTDAEWEYIARNENNQSYMYSGSDIVDDVAWYKENSSKAQTIKTKNPNSLGIYDLSGNICEWCYDWYSTTITNNTPTTGPEYKNSSNNFRVIRGGSWHGDENYDRVYDRYHQRPTANFDFGFRVVRTVFE